MSTKVRGLIVLTIVAMMVALYFTPHLAAARLRAAAQSNDAEGLASYVDFPSLRESARSGLTSRIQTELANRSPSQETAYASLGAVLATALINPMVDTLVTPQGLASLMKGEKPRNSQPANQGATNDPGFETSYGYEDVDQFVVNVRRKTASDNAVGLVFIRSGLVSWKLSRLRLPL